MNVPNTGLSYALISVVNKASDFDGQDKRIYDAKHDPADKNQNKTYAVRPLGLQTDYDLVVARQWMQDALDRIRVQPAQAHQRLQ